MSGKAKMFESAPVFERLHLAGRQKVEGIGNLDEVGAAKLERVLSANSRTSRRGVRTGENGGW